MTRHQRTSVGPTALLDGVARRHRRWMLRGAEPIDIPAGGLVLVEGDPSNDLYVLTAGTLAVTAWGSQLALLDPGEHFGEVGALTDAPRSATVQAIEGSTVLRLDGGQFRHAHRRSPALRANVATAIRSRAAQLALEHDPSPISRHGGVAGAVRSPGRSPARFSGHPGRIVLESA
jgi:CRP-like cAMP-binding protein